MVHQNDTSDPTLSTQSLPTTQACSSSVSSPADLYYPPPPPKIRSKPDHFEVVVENLDVNVVNIAGGDDPVTHNNAYPIILEAVQVLMRHVG